MKHGIKAVILSFFLVVAHAGTTKKPDLFLLKTYDGTKNVSGWVMSEKLDGVRGFWNGEKLLSRNGNDLNPPAWFIENYPPFAIDGELWTKRGDFENIVSIVRRADSGDGWRHISHQIFEVPNQPGGLFERLDVLRSYLEKMPIKHLRIIEQIKIADNRQLREFLDKITANKGEGAVVRNPDTPYKTGRLSSALKVKKYFDAECVVLKVIPGKGKYEGKMGSVLCRTTDEKNVKIGSGFTDGHRENPPPVGRTITFKYYGFTKKGKHKYPVFLRIKK